MIRSVGRVKPASGGYQRQPYRSVIAVADLLGTYFNNPDPLVDGNFPVDDRGRKHQQNPPSCTACHGSVISATVPWDFPAYQPDCAACHANDFQREGDHIGGSSGTVSQNRNCGGSGCHSASSRGW